MKPNQSFKDHAQHWRNQAANLSFSFTEKEMIDLFILSLRSLFLELLMCNPATNFTTIMKAWLELERFIKCGKLKTDQNDMKRQSHQVSTIPCLQQHMKEAH